MIDERIIKRTCFYCAHFVEPLSPLIGREGQWPAWGYCPIYGTERGFTYSCPKFYNTGENSWEYCGDLEIVLRALQR